MVEELVRVVARGLHRAQPRLERGRVRVSVSVRVRVRVRVSVRVRVRIVS